MTMLADNDAEFDVNDMADAFRDHTAKSPKHVILVTSYRTCDECGGSCDDEGDNLVSIFSTWESAEEWMQSLPDGMASDLEPIVIDNPEYGAAELGEVH